MDSITQAVLGAAVGEAVLGKRLGNRALVWGAVFGTLPDLDILLFPFLDTTGKLIHHRGASHSLFVILLASLILASLLSGWWRKDGVSAFRAGCFVFWVWITHILIDCFTVYGTSVFWPFSDYRVGFNNLFIIDPFYTGPLVLSLLLLMFFRKPEQQLWRRRLCWWGLGVSSAYVVLSLLMKWEVSNQFAADLERRGVEYQRRMEAPAPLNVFLWRAVVDRGDEFWVGYRSVFESDTTPIDWVIFPREHEVATPYMDEREIQTIDWFADGWWIARPYAANGLWLADLRFGETRLWRIDQPGVDHALAFAWIFDPNAEQDRLRQVRWGDRNVAEGIRRLLPRVAGKKDEWELPPRLVGTGRPYPEPLRMVE
jgi:inner membrane protein